MIKRYIVFSITIILFVFSSLIVVDFLNYNISYKELIDLNQTIKYKISKSGLIDEDFKKQYLERYNINIISSKTRYEVGETCEYCLTKNLNLIYKNITETLLGRQVLRFGLK